MAHVIGCVECPVVGCRVRTNGAHNAVVAARLAQVRLVGASGRRRARAHVERRLAGQQLHVVAGGRL